jgi:hypothetical protein
MTVEESNWKKWSNAIVKAPGVYSFGPGYKTNRPFLIITRKGEVVVHQNVALSLTDPNQLFLSEVLMNKQPRIYQIHWEDIINVRSRKDANEPYWKAWIIDNMQSFSGKPGMFRRRRGRGIIIKVVDGQIIEDRFDPSEPGDPAQVLIDTESNEFTYNLYQAGCRRVRWKDIESIKVE